MVKPTIEVRNNRIVQARFETPHFDFEAYGKTEEEALRVLRDAWENHALHYGADLDYLEEYIEDVCYLEIKLGVGYRDGMEILDGKE